MEGVAEKLMIVSQNKAKRLNKNKKTAMHLGLVFHIVHELLMKLIQETMNQQFRAFS